LCGGGGGGCFNLNPHTVIVLICLNVKEGVTERLAVIQLCLIFHIKNKEKDTGDRNNLLMHVFNTQVTAGQKNCSETETTIPARMQRHKAL